MFTQRAPLVRSGVAGLALAGLLGLPGLPGLSGGGGSSSSSASAAPSDWSALGRTWASGGKLRPSCHEYAYHYRVAPPTKDWSLETFLRGPSGKRLASDVILSGADPTRGTKRFEVCRSNTHRGRFTIRAKLTYKDDETDHSGWLRPSHFRLH